MTWVCEKSTIFVYCRCNQKGNNMKTIKFNNADSTKCADCGKHISNAECTRYGGICRICWGIKRLGFVKSQLKLYI